MLNSVVDSLGAPILELIKEKATGGVIKKVSDKLGDVLKSFSITLGDVMRNGNYSKAKIIIYDDLDRPYIIPEVEFHQGENGMPGNLSYCINILDEDERDKYIVNEPDTAIVRIEDNDVIFKDLLFIIVELFKGGMKNNINNGKLDLNKDGYFNLQMEMDDNETVHIAITPDGAMKRLIKNDLRLEQ